MPGRPIYRRYRLLETEKPNPRSRNVDLLSALGIVRLMNREDAKVASAVGRQARDIAWAVDLIVESLRRGGALKFVGAGTSGRLGVVEAAECPPTFQTPPSLIRAAIAGGPGAIFRSREGAEDDAWAGEAAVRDLRQGDVAVGIAASGMTPYVLGALRAARRRRARTILVTSSARRASRPADIVIALAVGPEVIGGSTRLKSGSAAKMVLNMLTTAAMIRLGKVYGHWMVDLRPQSRKLRFRAQALVEVLGQVGWRRAATLLKEAGGSVKTAVLMALGGLERREAERRLKRAGGFLRQALAEGRVTRPRI